MGKFLLLHAELPAKDKESISYLNLFTYNQYEKLDVKHHGFYGNYIEDLFFLVKADRYGEHGKFFSNYLSSNLPGNW